MSKTPSILASPGSKPYAATDVAVQVPRWDTRGVVGRTRDLQLRVDQLRSAEGHFAQLGPASTAPVQSEGLPSGLWASRNRAARSAGASSISMQWRSLAGQLAHRLQLPNRGREFFNAAEIARAEIRATWAQYDHCPDGGEAWIETPVAARQHEAPLVAPLASILNTLRDPYRDKAAKRTLRQAVWAAHSRPQHVRSLLGLFQDLHLRTIGWDALWQVLQSANALYKQCGAAIAGANLFSPLRSRETSVLICSRGYSAELTVAQLLAQVGHQVRTIPSLKPRTMGCVDFMLDRSTLAELKFTQSQSVGQWRSIIRRAVKQMERSHAVFRSSRHGPRTGMLIWAYNVAPRYELPMWEHVFEHAVSPGHFDRVLLLNMQFADRQCQAHGGLQELHKGARGYYTRPYVRTSA